MPKYTSQVVCRFLKPLSVAYHELATSQHAAIKHRETFVRDKNMGLVNQVILIYTIKISILKRWRVCLFVCLVESTNFRNY